MSAQSKCQKSKNQLLLLSEISETGQTWDKHRVNADKVSSLYAEASEHKFQRYAWRIKMCSEWLKFRLVLEESKGIHQLQLSDARFCRVRHCPICQWRRSLMWKAKAYKILPQVIGEYPNHRWLFMTLTVKNCLIFELRETLDWMNKAFKRLTELKAWSAVGWIKSVEVTRGQDKISAHPHLHVLAMVAPSYFNHGYFSHTEWMKIWQRCLRVDYQPIVHISAIAQDCDPIRLVPEILKYQVKESDLISNKKWLLELTRQLHKTRAIAVGGVLRKYMRLLEESNQDLIDSNRETKEVNEETLSFRACVSESGFRLYIQSSEEKHQNFKNQNLKNYNLKVHNQGMKCRYCASKKICKNGYRRGKQNYICSVCGRQFVEYYSSRGYSYEIKQKCISMYLNGMSYRAIERQIGVNHNTIINWIRNRNI